MKKFLIIIIAVLSLYQGAAFAEGNNLLKNADFEESDSDSPYFWNQYVWDSSNGASEIKVATDLHHQGSNCARITNGQPNDTRLKQTVNVNPSTIYKISGWIKTQDVGTNNKGANFSADMILETSADIKGTTDWQYVEMFGRTGGEQKELIVTIGLGGYGSLNNGTAYFDDISVEEVTDLPPGANIINLYSAQSNTASASGDSGGKGWLIALAVFLILAIAVVTFFVLKKPSAPKNSPSNPPDKPNSSNNSGKKADAQAQKSRQPVFKIDRKDLIAMGTMTLIYIIIALYNLGSLNVPETYWKPTVAGEGFTIKLDREYDISKIGYYNNIGDGKYNVKYKNSNGSYVPIGTFNQDVYNVIRWNYIDNLQIRTNEVKIAVDAVTDPRNGPALSEITLYEKGSKEPIKGFTIEPFNIDPKDKGQVSNLFDEQDKVSYYNTYMNSSYFDEIYHPRTAFENIHRMEPYETTHPPLGKLILSLGILIFGMNPFGWRIMGTLFGAAMIPAMYLIGKKMFNKRIYGFISAFLMMFDCMHFAQTRIGTIDSYPTLFVILTYFFMYDAFIKKSYKIGFKQSLKPLLLTGIFWGLGSASKWTAVYAAFGIATLFITAKVLEYMDYRKATHMKSAKSKLPPWTRTFFKKNIFYTGLCCVVFFIVIPVIIYVSSYLPIITLPGPNHNLEEVVRYQQNMYDYHADLTATHPFQSAPYMWPLDYKPLLEYRDTSLPSDKVSYMYVLGNPAIFWLGLLSIFASIAIGLWKRDKRVFFLLAAFCFQYLPWLLENRGGCVFIYHFFSAVPFFMLFVVYILKFVYDELPKIIAKAYMKKDSLIKAQKVSKIIVYSYLAIVVLMFIWLYPAMSGYTVDVSYVKSVKWLHLL